MSSDSQFTATGEADVGFQTHSSSIHRGVDVHGFECGVIGTADGPTPGDGVRGFGFGSFSGVAGFADRSNGGTGVVGFGGAPNGPGVKGVASGSPGDPSVNPPVAVGVFGIAFDGDGVFGTSTFGNAIRGVSGNPQFGSSGLAGFFEGDVQINGRLTVTQPKSAVVAFSDGTHRRLYCTESPECWFEDFGIGQLENGQAEVQIDPNFASVVEADTYHVFLTEYEDNNGLYVTGRTNAGFTVRAKTSRISGAQFSYRIVAKRKDVAAPRFERVVLPKESEKRKAA